MEKRKLNWVRTGNSHKELSINAGGEITYEEEKAGRKTRNVVVSYRSFSKEKQEEINKKLNR